MKKKYEPSEFEIIRIDGSDIIVTSQTVTPSEPDNDNNPFEGTYDSNGWT